MSCFVYMNPRLADMAKDDAIYEAGALSLLGDSSSKEAKEWNEKLRCLNMAMTKISIQARNSRFLRGGCSYKQ